MCDIDSTYADIQLYYRKIGYSGITIVTLVAFPQSSNLVPQFFAPRTTVQVLLPALVETTTEGRVVKYLLVVSDGCKRYESLFRMIYRNINIPSVADYFFHAQRFSDCCFAACCWSACNFTGLCSESMGQILR